MVGWRAVAIVFAVATAIVVVAVAVASHSDTKTLSKAETKSLLRELPYRFRFDDVPSPDGASGAVAGRAFGPHRTTIRFGVSLGSGGAPVSLGPHTDFADATGGETFRVTNDATIIVGDKLERGPRIVTEAQWRQSATMVVDIEEKLCRATEGKACAI